MRCPFQSAKVQQLTEDLNSVVPIRYVLDENMRSRAGFDFKEGYACVSFQPDADEHVDILHELLHVQQLFKQRFCQLAWITDDTRITGELRQTVNLIRFCADDTWVFWRLYDDYDVFPISDIFFIECENDSNKGFIGHVRDETGAQNKSLQAAWRTQREVCKDA